jgi:hypothetical protein
MGAAGSSCPVTGRHHAGFAEGVVPRRAFQLPGGHVTAAIGRRPGWSFLDDVDDGDLDLVASGQA